MEFVDDKVGRSNRSSLKRIDPPSPVIVPLDPCSWIFWVIVPFRPEMEREYSRWICLTGNLIPKGSMGRALEILLRADAYRPRPLRTQQGAFLWSAIGVGLACTTLDRAKNSSAQTV